MVGKRRKLGKNTCILSNVKLISVEVRQRKTEAVNFDKTNKPNTVAEYFKPL